MAGALLMLGVHQTHSLKRTFCVSGWEISYLNTHLRKWNDAHHLTILAAQKNVCVYNPSQMCPV